MALLFNALVTLFAFLNLELLHFHFSGESTAAPAV